VEWQLERGGLHPDTQLDAPKVNDGCQVYVFAALNQNAFSNAGRPSHECEGRLVFWNYLSYLKADCLVQALAHRILNRVAMLDCTAMYASAAAWASLSGLPVLSAQAAA
jgi:hypothetical protein